MMKKLLRSWFVVGPIVFGLPFLAVFGPALVQPVHAASATLSTNPTFDAAWPQIVVGLNNATCAANGQAAGCSSVPGCVASFSRNAATGIATFNTCTLYTADGPGEAAWAQD
ncbi:MAG TPA: hypothetical protein VKW04_24950, partial [Planctomycetota bacterium]|nr:hypothetical protein [Planctomycetota bacterium]